MVTTSSRILDDIARLATDAAGAAQGVRREVETVVKTQIERRADVQIRAADDARHLGRGTFERR